METVLLSPVPVHAVMGWLAGTTHSVRSMVPPAGIPKDATEVATLEAPIPTKTVAVPEFVITRSRALPYDAAVAAAVVYIVPAVVVIAVDDTT